MMASPALGRLEGGRLHLQHGPMDVVLRAWGAPNAVRAAEAAAARRFATILAELVTELPELRRPASAASRIGSPVGQRMAAACLPFARSGTFVTPMAAVAGAVADELMAAMRAAAPELRRAFVNDGGDIALHVAGGETLAVGLAANPALGPVLEGSVLITAGGGVGGVASSGRHGRSFSLGIADSVTVLAADAATADAAATLVANAVDLDSPAVSRCPATDLDPDSDLGDLPVTVAVSGLTAREVGAALEAGTARAEAWCRAGLIRGAALRLAGEVRVAGPCFRALEEAR